MVLTVGVLALQGGFSEHLASLRKASSRRAQTSLSPSPSQPDSGLSSGSSSDFHFIEVRTPEQLASCHALIIPGGESTTLSLVAAQSGLLQPLRDFVKVSKKPTWGTCAGLILLSEAATSTKRGGQELIGGLDVRVHRNHFGRQRESFVTELDLPFLSSGSAGVDQGGNKATPFPAVFIRAPVVDELLTDQVQSTDGSSEPAPGNQARGDRAKVEVLAILPGRHASNKKAIVGDEEQIPSKGNGDIVALRQGNVFGTSFHPELTDDARIHEWWLGQIEESYRQAP